MEWQPIDTAPEATNVLVWLPNAGIDVANKTTVHGLAHWWNKGESEQCYPTYWAPLPEAPNGGVQAPCAASCARSPGTKC